MTNKLIIPKRETRRHSLAFTIALIREVKDQQGADHFTECAHAPQPMGDDLVGEGGDSRHPDDTTVNQVSFRECGMGISELWAKAK